MKTVPARSRPSVAVSVDLAAVLIRRAERLERVKVRIEAASADHVAARRRHHCAAEASKQRAGQQERRANRLGERPDRA